MPAGAVVPNAHVASRGRGRFLGLALLLLLGTIATAGPAGAAAPTYDIPRLEGITIDGNPKDWGDRGFAVRALANAEGALKSAADLDASFRVGWNEQGLLVLVTVRDNVAVESASVDDLYQGDAVEVFIAPDTGRGSVTLQSITAPGRDPKTPELRRKFYDGRAKPKDPFVGTFARVATPDGYVVEALYPWTGLGITPKSGTQFRFSLWADDSDAPGSTTQVAWLPTSSSEVDSRATHVLRLADRSSPPVLAAVTGAYEKMRRVVVRVVADGTMADRPVSLLSNGKAVVKGKLEGAEGRGVATLELPLPAPGQAFPALSVAAGGGVYPVDLPDLGQARARAVLDLPFNAHPAVFNGAGFPGCDFDQPNLAEDTLGRYAVKTTYYDANYAVVTGADQSGRYGAVVTVTPEHGRPLTYFRTLYRLPDGFDLGFFPRMPQVRAELPQLRGLDPAVLKANAVAINDVVQQCLVASTDRTQATAILLAGLYGAPPTSEAISPQNDVFAQDRQWWVGLKRKLYGLEQTYPTPFVCPTPKEGAPAPVVHQGTLDEAGMKPDMVEKLDTLLQTWAADSDQGFAVCIVRHGAIVLSKAYGQRDGRPMTVTDKSWMASISKLLAGTAMMMAVDQGRVNLDDPVTKFLPSFRGVNAPRPLTVRHLYTHTGGLWGHWGDEMSDFDQLIGYYYPYLQVGQRYEYDGAGPALGSKVLEMVSGESLPLFHKHHLLDPLGCADTSVTTSSWDAQSTALDIAKIGQMLLNKGAYGNMRFFREETFRQMLPEKVTRLVPTDTTTEYGMGTSWYDWEGLGKGTFGHGAASSATIRIDPMHDLVIAMTRNDAGRNFNTYHPRFIRAVVDCIAEGK